MIDEAIQATEDFLKQAEDPVMRDILNQLRAMKAGHKAQYTIGRIIAYQFTPAPNAEIQDWAEKVLEAWDNHQTGKS